MPSRIQSWSFSRDISMIYIFYCCLYNFSEVCLSEHEENQWFQSCPPEDFWFCSKPWINLSHLVFPKLSISQHKPELLLEEVHKSSFPPILSYSFLALHNPFSYVSADCYIYCWATSQLEQLPSILLYQHKEEGKK